MLAERCGYRENGVLTWGDEISRAVSELGRNGVKKAARAVFTHSMILGRSPNVGADRF
jgi:hypothetical protein